MLKLMTVQPSCRHFAITTPEIIRPIIDAPLLATGPTNPDVEALLRKTNSKYFGKNCAKPMTDKNVKMFESKVNT